MEGLIATGSCLLVPVVLVLLFVLMLVLSGIKLLY
jgi:hypothetical protein